MQDMISVSQRRAAVKVNLRPPSGQLCNRSAALYLGHGSKKRRPQTAFLQLKKVAAATF